MATISAQSAVEILPQPGLGDKARAHAAQADIDHAEERVEEQLEQIAHDNGGEHDRQEDSDAVEAGAGQFAPQRIGEDEAQPVLQHHQGEKHDDVVGKGVARPAGIGLDEKHGVEIGEAAEFTAQQAIPVEKGISESRHDRIDDEQSNKGQRRHQQRRDPKATSSHP
ncbi:hypothetical protein N8D56_00060 [Devosia sp. A8/3-2]|nr:hypothetical protein N8D56_00060 [Devosia sp. A8/3-2]